MEGWFSYLSFYNELNLPKIVFPDRNFFQFFFSEQLAMIWNSEFIISKLKSFFLV